MKIFKILIGVILLLEIIINVDLIKKKKINKDLVFFLITNYILTITLGIFFLFYEDLLIAFLTGGFLLFNSSCLLYEIKKYNLINLSYIGLITYVFCLITDYYLGF